MSNHSPLPWTPRRSEVFGSTDIRDVFDAERREVRVMGFGLTGGTQAAANADLIVRAVNAHAEMLDALRIASATLKMLTAPNVIQATSVGSAWLSAVNAEAKVRDAIATAEGR